MNSRLNGLQILRPARPLVVDYLHYRADRPQMAQFLLSMTVAILRLE